MANIIFDFDGTIADTLPMVVGIVSKWTGRDVPVNDKELQRLRNLSLHQIMEELGIRPWRVPGMLIRGRREMGKRIDEIPLIEGMGDTIKKLRATNHVLYIMSSNSTKNIRAFLKQNDLHDCFKRVYGGVGLLSKAEALKKVMKDNDLNNGRTFYVGDETRDVHAAHKAGVKVIAVIWGFNGEEALAKDKPTAIAKTPAELTRLLLS